MPVVTAAEVVSLTNTTATAGTITSSGLIPIVQDKINYITNNYFLKPIEIQGSLTFDATANTIVSGASFTDYGFANSDEIYIYGSYRNDGYKTISTVSTTTITLVTTSTVVAELSGANIMISLVHWPDQLKHIAAQMVAYDYDVRRTREQGITSRTLGPFSESYESGNSNKSTYGYPLSIISQLEPWCIVHVY